MNYGIMIAGVLMMVASTRIVHGSEDHGQLAPKAAALYTEGNKEKVTIEYDKNGFHVHEGNEKHPIATKKLNRFLQERSLNRVLHKNMSDVEKK